ncbi:hypothetical protein E4U42_005207 [Claviceps africana]|uniref:Uncharacterized protein n=1 Tax=Claviceps africana TaxID=83212 RepID=A0A8K0J504_9HYPO|nr:hypothetical protein E4U42_005207 [Claviceps africana]
MKTFVLLVSLLSLGASAVPTEFEEQVIFDGKYTYYGGDVRASKNTAHHVLMDLQRQCSCSPCWSGGISCTPYQCECVGNNGCYRCRDGTYRCQPGPYSDECN